MILKTCFAVIVLALVPFQKPGKIETSYDKFKDRTTVETNYMRVAGSDWNSNPLEIAARLNYPGQTPSKPRLAILYFYSATKTWRFKTEPTVLLLVDGERVDLGKAVLMDQDIHADRYSVSVREYLGVAVPFSTFEKIAGASSVEMQLGEIEFGLSDKVLATFRELAQRVR